MEQKKPVQKKLFEEWEFRQEDLRTELPEFSDLIGPEIERFSQRNEDIVVMAANQNAEPYANLAITYLNHFRGQNVRPLQNFNIKWGRIYGPDKSDISGKGVVIIDHGKSAHTFLAAHYEKLKGKYGITEIFYASHRPNYIETFNGNRPVVAGQNIAS